MIDMRLKGVKSSELIRLPLVAACLVLFLSFMACSAMESTADTSDEEDEPDVSVEETVSDEEPDRPEWFGDHGDIEILNSSDVVVYLLARGDVSQSRDESMRESANIRMADWIDRQLEEARVSAESSGLEMNSRRIMMIRMLSDEINLESAEWRSDYIVDNDGMRDNFYGLHVPLSELLQELESGLADDPELWNALREEPPIVDW